MASPDNAPRRVGLLVGGLLLFVLATMLVVMQAFRPMRTTAGATPTADTPGPRLQSAPQPDLAAYRARKQAELAAIGALEGEPGWARIPLRRAMELMSKDGLRATGVAAPENPQ